MNFRSFRAPLVAISFLLTPLILTGCGGSDSSVVSAPNGPPAAASSTFRSVRFTLSADNKYGTATYNRGQYAQFSFRITNEGSEEVTLIGGTFPAQLAVSQNGKEVWRAEYGSSIIGGDDDTEPTGSGAGSGATDGAAIPRVLQPGESLDYPLVWPLVDKNGDRVLPGDYQAVAWFEARPRLNDGTDPQGPYEEVNPRVRLTSGTLPIAVR